MVKIERISTGGQKCGEGPHWDDATQSLIYVDIFGQNILRWDERRQQETKIHIESASDPVNKIADCTTLIVPIQDRRDAYVISRGNRLATLEWDGCSSSYSTKDFVHVDEDVLFPMSFNDGKCDSRGCLWVGTMSEETAPGIPKPGTGSIYSFSSDDGSATKRHSGISLSNGMAFAADGKSFFHIDTYEMKVEVFDYDMASTSISNRRTVYDVAGRRTPGLPDGMTIDTQGRLWVALYFGGMVVCLDSSTGQLVHQVHLPATNITSCTFGGPSYDTLYVTSATYGLAEWQMKAQPDAGATFKVTGLGARGTTNIGWNVNYDTIRAL